MEKYLSILGFTVKDKVTGFTGIADGICFDLYGCILVTVKPSVAKDKPNELSDGRWFDFHRLTVTSKQPVMTPPDFMVYPNPPKENIGSKGPAEKSVRSNNPSMR